MRATSTVLLTCVGSLSLLVSAAAPSPVGTAFTYQGRLTDGGSPASGVYDLQFTLYDAVSGGAQVGSRLVLEDVTATNGLFTVSLDFGAIAFAGEARWLEVGTRPGASTGSFTILSPRQELTPSPNAVFSQKAPWAGLAGVPAGFADGTDNDLLGGLSCANGQIAKWNGAAWACAADADSGGDITAVGTAAGSGLQGGVATGAANLSLLTTCTGSQVLKWNGAAWACATDADSGGDITEVIAGTGLAGGGVSGAVTLNANLAGSGAASTLARSDHDHFGATWSGTTQIGLQVVNAYVSGLGIQAYSMDSTGQGVAVFGSTFAPGGKGVYGEANSASGADYGVYGLSSSNVGVYGGAGYGPGSTYGVMGESVSTSGRGVYGQAWATTGYNYGVYGNSSSTQGRGVYGVASAATGFAYGVAGWSQSASGRGLHGLASQNTGANYGVYGESASSNGTGVYGLASATSGQTHGVYGESASSNGTGVYGWADAAAGWTYGVRGEISSSDGTAVSGLAWATTGYNYGVYGQSNSSSGTGVLGAGGGTGVYAFGSVGVTAVASSGTGRAYLATGDRGIWAKGTFAGGTFSHPNDVTFWADVATPTSKIAGTGTVSFVQNHPYERDRVLVYAAPEGDEVAVYTRGSARLVEGVAHVKLGPTFAWVANPDLGLTAHLTPRGQAASLWVESVGTDELVVRGWDGSNAAFDYLVYGLRIGFEELPVVQPKRREAFLPDPATVTEQYGGQTDLQAFSPLDRFRGMRAELGDPAPLELSRARALAAAIDTGRAEVLAAADEELARERAEMEARRLRRGDDRKQPAPTLEADRGPAPPSVPSPPPALASSPVRLADLPAARSVMPAAEPEERAAALAAARSAAVALPVSEPAEPGDLHRSFVKPPDTQNACDGVVTTDGSGYATVDLPAWFEALNRDFRYQLTVIGQFAQAIVASEIEAGRFTIQTDKPAVRVSWQVTGIRKDGFAEKRGIPVEPEQPETERGLRQRPDASGR